MKTIVTGGAGFIGSHLVDRLLADGNEVIVVDNFDPFYDRATKEANLAGALENPRCRLVELDIRDARGSKRLVSESRPDVIVHLAARAGVRPSIADPRLYTDVNVLGTVVWLEAASRLEPRPRFIYASSSSVYGDRAEGPFRETDSVDLPVSPYAATKKACELAGSHLSSPARAAGHRPAVFHRLRPAQSARPGHRQVHAVDRSRTSPCRCSATARPAATIPTWTTSSTASSARSSAARATTSTIWATPSRSRFAT